MKFRKTYYFFLFLVMIRIFCASTDRFVSLPSTCKFLENFMPLCLPFPFIHYFIITHHLFFAKREISRMRLLLVILVIVIVVIIVITTIIILVVYFLIIKHHAPTIKATFIF